MNLVQMAVARMRLARKLGDQRVTLAEQMANTSVLYLTYARKGAKVYEFGTVPPAVVADRRVKNKAARRSRRVNRLRAS